MIDFENELFNIFKETTRAFPFLDLFLVFGSSEKLRGYTQPLNSIQQNHLIQEKFVAGNQLSIHQGFWKRVYEDRSGLEVGWISGQEALVWCSSNAELTVRGFLVFELSIRKTKFGIFRTSSWLKCNQFYSIDFEKISTHVCLIIEWYFE